MSTPTSTKPLRADARRNRERILTAARECFRRLGSEAQVDDVARAAGVGVGTVYRHFPTKEALLQEIAAERFRELVEIVVDARHRIDDPWEALNAALWRAGERQAEDVALQEATLDYMEGGPTPDAIADLQAQTDVLLQRAKAAGQVREDVSVQDISIVMCGTCGVMRRPPGQEPDAWRRMLTLALEGIRAR